MQRGPHRFTAADIPWFVGLFGRDSLLPTLQCLARNPALGAHTTRALAHWQGRRDDDRTMEQFGKILHELRVGEITHLREVTQTPSYAAVDSTLLFLIATPEHAARIAERIMQPDMLSGWGVRTLSSDHPRFDPLAYQQGSVWPFDTSLIVAGLRRYGQDKPVVRLTRATLDTAACFCLHRLPEFIAGTQRRPGEAPVHTPARRPDAGLVRRGTAVHDGDVARLRDRRFRAPDRRPMLPPGVQRLRLADLEACGERITLEVMAAEDGSATVAISGAAWSLQHDEHAPGV